MPPYHPENFRDRVFGRLTVIGHLPTRAHGEVVYRCKCECGNERDVSRQNLLSGNTSSCGCLRREISSEIGKRMQKERRAHRFTSSQSACVPVWMPWSVENYG